MELSQWYALESGWVPDMPDDMDMIQTIAGTLETSWAEFSFLALMADLGVLRQPGVLIAVYPHFETRRPGQEVSVHREAGETLEHQSRTFVFTTPSRRPLPPAART